MARAAASGIKLSSSDAALIKGMISRGDRQHDIAAWFGVNGGRIAEIVTGEQFHEVIKAKPEELPPRGPYPNARVAYEAMAALVQARTALETAEHMIIDLTQRH